MSNRKAEATSLINERDYPYIVELPVPENGFGDQLDVMHLFHVNVGIEARQERGRYDEGRHYIRWCFADPQHATSFQALFGGEVIGYDKQD